MKKQIAKNIVMIFLSVLTIACISSYGGIIDWGSAGKVLYAQDGETLLPVPDPEADVPQEEAGFIQLLHLGERIYDYTDRVLAEIGGDGTLGDDKVIAKSWVGELGAPFFPDGTFTAGIRPDANPYTSGVDNFAIRIFDTPSPDWDAGLIPLTGNYNYVFFESPVKNADNWYTLVIDTNVYTVLPVPEPSSLALIGMIGLALVSRRWYTGESARITS